MQTMWRLGAVLLLAGIAWNLMAAPRGGEARVDRRLFESVGTVDSIAPYNGRVTIDGKHYGLSRHVRLIGLGTGPNDGRAALFQVRDRRIGYAFGIENGKRVVTAIMVLPEK